ncbi:MAG: type II toxin-antitoxin system HicB family antitoxin [Methylicorpusculum sp.]|uniref:type II toxin-antitoxin system HicB family antitoxin n=1 Tax=Methylicorpusculum sp. TaxID=2713644 RepID=UPI002728C9DB|nr:type II toxin-antitoxin system HicB family antitoxin [Methylicorpusculum sp.]MDO8941127.1 type II toxin-antitoxin system HicB family antitoxin [Methylicorpusculum sp.]MDO9239803.1 type II toxin-antitoxin system HicB family antitoxin [Methylicorpusculum sp.]MDP2176945.1 type II toxin-antitoxin system HicB family antitoxin [Methylicorpusculum sp.]MDP2204578.1 type II toxin-antitoxin system HicB family antitoxin [Methylicorpusculum sp.]MDP3528715.1 type II toxin-antitoxin system HicB family an
MNKYEMIIYWSEPDQAYLVEVPELAGCMADGKSYQEAVKNAEEVIQEWIDTAVELGRAVPEPKGRLLYA